MRTLKRPLILPLLGGLWMLYSHLLFWIDAPLFDITPDYFDYYSLANRWMNGLFGSYGGVLIDLPLGLPLLLYAKMQFGLSTPGYIAMQVICLFLVYALVSRAWVRNWGWYGAWAALLLGAYLADGYSLAFFTSPLTEPPFLLLFLLALSLLPAVLKPQPKPVYAILFGLVLMLLPLFRSNGILLWPWVMAVLIYLFFKKSKAFRPLLGTVLISGFFLLGLSWLLVGYPNYGNMQRLSRLVYKTDVPANAEQKPDATPNRGDKNGSYLLNTAYDRPSFYYTLLPARIEKHLMHKKLQWEGYTMYDNAVPVPKPWRQDLWHEMQAQDLKYGITTQFKEQAFSRVKSGQIFLQIQHLGYVLHSLLLNNILWIVLALASVGLAAMRIRGPHAADAAYLWFLAFAFVLLALVLDFNLSKHLPRYGYVQDFIPYLMVPLGLRLFFKKASPHAPQ